MKLQTLKSTSAGHLRPARVFFLLILAGIAAAGTESPLDGAKVWVETSLHRVFPNSPVGENRHLNLVAARNQTLSFQACVRNNTKDRLRVDCTVAGNADLKIRVRRVGYVPMPHRTTDVALTEEDGAQYIPGWFPIRSSPSRMPTWVRGKISRSG